MQSSDNNNTTNIEASSENEYKIGNLFVMQTNEKLGSGAFGEIYKGYNVKTKEEVAIKLEPHSAKTPQLNYESKILKLLQGGTGIPTLHLLTNIGEHTIMIIDLLGLNLEDLLAKTPNKKFSMNTVLMIADQLINRIEFIHSKSIIHRDIKPENFLIGVKKKSSIIYVIDFGLAKRYKDPKTGEHIPYIEGKSITGTVRYVSIYTHLGIEQSRRDDFESLGYVLIYLVKGELPWQGQKAKTKKEKYKKIMDKKIETTPDVLCEDLPEEFCSYFKYIRELQFDEKPDYVMIKQLFKTMMAKCGCTNNLLFDWCVKENSATSNAKGLSEIVFGMNSLLNTKITDKLNNLKIKDEETNQKNEKK